ncbi:MAG: hypothetical protein R3F14_02290 [Polyangiaceae bacterium]
MRSFFHLPVSAIIATVSLFGAVAGAAGSSIEAARSAPEGTVVTVEGVVSVPSGSYDPNDLGFAIQAGNKGIYIHDSLGGDYALGETVTVTGTVGDSFGQVYGVYPDSIDVTGSHPVHPAKPVDTADVSEDTEGTLVRVRGVVTDEVFDDAPYGWIFHVDDGSGELTVFVYTGTGIDTSGIEPGDELEITGFSGQFIDHYELNPRFQSDIVER